MLLLSRAGYEMFQSVQKRLMQTLRTNELIRERVHRLMTIPGVGEITALTWDHPGRGGQVGAALECATGQSARERTEKRQPEPGNARRGQKAGGLYAGGRQKPAGLRCPGGSKGGVEQTQHTLYRNHDLPVGPRRIGDSARGCCDAAEICFEADGLTHTQSSAEVSQDTGRRERCPASNAANGCLVARSSPTH